MRDTALTLDVANPVAAARHLLGNHVAAPVVNARHIGGMTEWQQSGRLTRLLPLSNVGFLRYLKSIVDLNAEVAHGAFDSMSSST